MVGVDKKNIINEVELLLDEKDAYEKMARSINPYGDGHASERIVQILIRLLKV